MGISDRLSRALIWALVLCPSTHGSQESSHPRRSLCNTVETLYSEDFENQVTAGWDNPKLEVLPTADATTFLGRYANQETTKKTFSITPQSSALFYQVEFDFIQIDTWDYGSDHFSPCFNGQCLTVGTFGFAQDEGTRTGQEHNIVWSMVSLDPPTDLTSMFYEDQIHHFVILIPKQKVTTELEIEFKFLIDEAVNNEAGGIDNVQIHQILSECAPDRPLTGSWEGPYDTSIVTSGGAVRDDGKVLLFSAFSKVEFGGDSKKTYTNVFDPETNTYTEELVDVTEHDMFCPGTAILGDGRMMFTGGSSAAAVTFYDPHSTPQWTVGEPLNIARGYHSMTVLGDGSVFTLGGSWSGNGAIDKDGELWDPADKKWHLKSGINVNAFLTGEPSDYHMWFFPAPDGRLFHAGPSPEMHWIDVTGSGSYSSAGLRKDPSESSAETGMNGNAVMYDVGKILTAGGSYAYTNSPAHNKCHTIDLNGNAPVVARTGDMSVPRAMANAVVMPDGNVIVIGGMPRGITFSDLDAHLHAEIWNPNTGEWTVDASMTVFRTYHSIAVLLKDGRVLSAGGGLCGEGCPENHPDAEIYTPKYLLKADGSPATRPVIVDAPATIVPGNLINVEMDKDARHTFVLIRTSASTHTVNNDQRLIPLKITGQSGATFTLEIPNNVHVVMPGTFFLFALNGDGTPSVAEAVSYNPNVH